MTDDERRVRTAVEELGYDFKQFTVPHFIAHLQTIRQRDIILNGVSFDQGLHGFWVRAETADYVFFNQNTHEIHQIHHILHELGHMVLCHQPRDLANYLPLEITIQLRTAISAEPQGYCRRWDPHDTPEEREAELFVRHLQQKLLLSGRMSALTHPDTSIDALSRFTRGLGYDG